MLSTDRTDAGRRPEVRDSAVSIPAHGVELRGVLTLPPDAAGVVLFAHGSGGGRFSPRDTFVASALHDAGLGSLRFDLLTGPEAADREKVFDIELLAGRLLHATEWIGSHPETVGLPVGYFGASTGAAAAIVAAAEAGPPVRAIVSRGGRPDLAENALSQTTAPILLIVGGADLPVLELNLAAFERLSGVKELAIVPRATHLFEEPGALEEVARLATRWCSKHLAPAAAPRAWSWTSSWSRPSTRS